MARAKATDRIPEISLPLILTRLARGEALTGIALSLGRKPSEVSGVLEDLARSMSSAETPVRATLRADGASRGNPGKAGAGWVLESGGQTFLDGYRYLGTATNNVAEYEAVILGMEKALELGIRDVSIELDSELVVRQINGEYRVKDAKLIERYHRLVHLKHKFSSVTVVHVPRAKNKQADELANRAIDEAEAEEPGNRKSEIGNRK